MTYSTFTSDNYILLDEDINEIFHGEFGEDEPPTYTISLRMASGELKALESKDLDFVSKVSRQLTMPSLPGGRVDMSYSGQKLILMAIIVIACLAILASKEAITIKLL